VILVTGVSGFIGKKLLTALVKEHGAQHILALTSKPTSECPYLLHHDYTFEKDYLIKSGYESIHTILHVGAFTPKSASEVNDWIRCSSNITNTQKLLQLELPQLNKFIFLSTVDVYGKAEMIAENSPTEPASLYGNSKLYCEKMISSWAKNHHKLLHLLRVGHIYGPGEEAYQKLIPATIQKLLANQSLQMWGTGNEIRSFLFIDNLIGAILKSVIIDSDIGIVNLVGSEKITVRELTELLREISGVNALIETVATTVEGRSLIFDNSKMQRELGQFEIPIRQGLTEEWEYMKKLKR
jgi:nucleoside-diphosphate-sugar epimerase